jgi:hypothetical protein
MTNDARPELQTEYAALSDWRISKLQRQDQWGAILFPVSVALFAGVMGLSNDKYGTMILGWLGSGILLFLWRWFDYHNDTTIRKYTYPRLVELEEILGFKSVREYLKNIWWPKHPQSDWLPTRSDIEARNRELDSVSFLKRVRGIGIGRPLFKWDAVALYLWVAESLIVLLFIVANVQGWAWAKYF